MCGISGLFDSRGLRPYDPSLVRAMNHAQLHRGPDDEGIFTRPGVALGHRRLSIIDLGGGHQPMLLPDGKTAIVFNGEIYNYRSLASQLVASGHVIRSSSDTEVILHAWRQWGEDCVQHLSGMFAFALWDEHRKGLFLARDRIGIKPLYWSHADDGTFSFASELKGLLALAGKEPRIDARAVDAYFALGYVPDPLCIYEDIHKLEPGCSLWLARGGPLRLQRYWDLHFKSHALPAAEAVSELQQRMETAVRSQLVADVPVGAFLSGGVDSSAVVASMARASPSRVTTFSVGFGEASHDETPWAREVAQRYQTRHEERRVDSKAAALVPLLAGLYDEPFADSSAMPTWHVCQLAASQLKVVLSGDGGDENFAGYRRYRLHAAEERVRRLLPPSLRQSLFATLARCYPKADWAPRVLRARSTFESLARNFADGYLDGVSLVRETARVRLFSKAFQAGLAGAGVGALMHDHASRGPQDRPLALMQYLDFKTWLPGDILTKVDRASMAHGLEVRVPLLDHDFVEWAATLPDADKLRHGQGKFVFKEALRPLLPGSVLDRPKQGFSVPLAAWLRGPLKQQLDDVLQAGRLADSGYFNMDEVTRLARRHAIGLGDHAAPLWALMMFDAFLQRHEQRPATHSLARPPDLAARLA